MNNYKWAMSAPVIQMFHVYKTYPSKQAALVDVTLKVERGDFVYITGPNGAGKSTLLKLILCAERPTKGQIFVDGINLGRIKKSSVPYVRRKIGGVFEDFRLLNNKTVFENVALAAEVTGIRKKKARERVWNALCLVGLDRKPNSLPRRLSMGERQFAALARAIVNNPLILLADEPTRNLDPDTADDIMDLVNKINIHGTTVIFSTRNRDLIGKNHRKVFVLEKGEVSDVRFQEREAPDRTPDTRNLNK